MEVKQPKFQVLYASKDITKDVSANLISVRYTDNEEGETDELELNIEDTDGLWRDAWYPTKGDEMQLKIGYKDEQLLDCGKFVIDEIQLSGAPDTITIRALAAATNSPLRTKKSTAHEKQTLKQIAQKLASANGYTVEGEIADVTLDRTTQYRESDLSFLARLARTYGHLFSIRGTTLIFTSIFKLENGQPVVELDRNQLLRYTVTDKSVKTFKSAKVSYREPKTNKVVSAEVKTGDALDTGGTVGGANDTTAADTLEIRDKAENEQQAKLKAQAALHRANTGGQDGNFSVYGEPLLVAGNNFTLTGMGKLSGNWHISASLHTIDRGQGYTTEITAKRLKDVAKPEQKKSKKRKPQKRLQNVQRGGGAGGVRELDSAVT